MVFFEDLYQYLWSGFCCIAFAHLLLRDEHKMENFGLRSPLCIIGYITLSSLLSIIGLIVHNDTYHYATYAIILLATFFIIAICYDVKTINVVFTVYLSIVFLQIVRLGVDFIVAFLAGSDIGVNSPVIRYVIFIVAFSVLYGILRYIVLKNVRLRMDNASKTQVAIFVGTGSVVMMLSVFNAIIKAYSNIYYMFFLLCQIACCMLIIFIQVTFVEKLNVEIEKAVVEHLYQRGSEQYETLKEKMEIINIKCHDIRHNIAEHMQLEQTDMDETIDEYDAFIHTGNSALDTVLTDMSLYCRVKEIMFTCVAQGILLSFMDANDICVLFGNAIENAMEYEIKVEKEKRFIAVEVKKVGEFTSIHIENYFVGELNLEEGLPITSKEDDIYHGFGMKSIKRIVEKYKGYMSITTADDMFQLDCLFEK